MKYVAILLVDGGDPEEFQGVTPDDAINQMLTALSLLGWSKDRHDYDIRIK
jgi:thioredoxin-like negative regulator of GroEL